MAEGITIIPLTGIGEVMPGADLAQVVAGSLAPATTDGPDLRQGDVLVITQKVVSKAEGRLVPIDPDDPAAKAALVERESVRIVRRRGDLIISETRHGFICANAGVDLSNVALGTAALLPEDADRSARRIRSGLRALLAVDVGVIVSDTFGRTWRRGVTDVAIGCAGIAAVVDLRGTADANGRELLATEVCRGRRAGVGRRARHGKGQGHPGRRGPRRARELAAPLLGRGPRSCGRPRRISSVEPASGQLPAHELDHRTGTVGQLGPGAPPELNGGPLNVEARAQQLTGPQWRHDRCRHHADLLGHGGVELVHRRLLAGPDVADQPTPA